MKLIKDDESDSEDILVKKKTNQVHLMDKFDTLPLKKRIEDPLSTQ